jgi:hypothetical protein
VGWGVVDGTEGKLVEDAGQRITHLGVFNDGGGVLFNQPGKPRATPVGVATAPWGLSVCFARSLARGLARFW